MSRVVVLAGGSPHAHDFDAIRDALVELVEGAGHAALPAADPDAAAHLLDDADALVCDGLWWRMEGAAYDPWRAAHAYSPPPGTRARLRDFVADGGGFVGLHTTSICFDDWPGWADVVGAGWVWGHSSHPPYGPATAHLVPAHADHPVLDGLPAAFDLHDEVYGDLDRRTGTTVLVTSRRHADDADQPVVLTQHYGRGRVVYDGFGHDAASIRHPEHRRLLAQALAWTLAGPDRRERP